MAWTAGITLLRRRLRLALTAGVLLDRLRLLTRLRGAGLLACSGLPPWLLAAALRLLILLPWFSFADCPVLLCLVSVLLAGRPLRIALGYRPAGRNLVSGLAFFAAGLVGLVLLILLLLLLIFERSL